MFSESKSLLGLLDCLLEASGSFFKHQVFTYNKMLVYYKQRLLSLIAYSRVVDHFNLSDQI